MIRAWLRLMWTSAAVAAVAAAAQLGIADAFGIIRWDATFGPGAEAAWDAMLVWVAFSYAVAVLTGAAAGHRAAPQPDTTGARMVAALTAGVGGVAATAIAWLQARAATPPVSVDPELVVSLSAGAGAIGGVIIAVLAMSAPPIAGGVRVAVAWTWLVGVGAAAAGLASDEALPAPRLAVIDTPSGFLPSWSTSPYVMVGVAVITGLTIAGIARWAGAARPGVAFSGLAGPGLIALAYVIAGPGDGASLGHQSEPYQASLFAVAAGLIASVLVALPARRGSGGPDASGGTGGYGFQNSTSGRTAWDDTPGGWGTTEPATDHGAYPDSESGRGAHRDPAAHGEDHRQRSNTYEAPDQRSAQEPPSYDESRHERSQYGQTPYGQIPYGDSPYGDSPYGQPAYGETPYGQGPYEQGSRDRDDDRGRDHEPRPGRHEQPASHADTYSADTAERPIVARATPPVPPAMPQPPTAPAAAFPPPVPQPTVPQPPTPAPTVMGQPPPDEYADWLKDLGQATRRDSGDR